MKKITEQEFEKFLELKKLLERRVEAKLIQDGKLDKTGSYALDVNWNCALSGIVSVKVYELKSDGTTNKEHIYYIRFSELYDKD